MLNKILTESNLKILPICKVVYTKKVGELLRKSVKIYREYQEEEGFTFDYEDESFRVEDNILEKEAAYA